MDHPPYSPDFALIDFYPFGHLNQHLGRKRFASDTTVEEAFTWIHTLDTSFFYNGI
jgi:hypothetical protein